MSAASKPSAVPRRRPAVGPGLQRLLFPVLGLFGLLAVNGAYLGSVTFLEWWTGEVHQDFLYQVMFLVHLVLGLLLILPALTFGALHLRNAWRRPNRAAVRAGIALYTAAVLLLASGVVLTRFDFFEVKDPGVRAVAYWVHVATPLIAAWLFVLHRLAGRAIRWRVGAAWAAVAVVFSLAMLLVRAPDPGQSADTASYAGDAFRPSFAKTRDGGLIPARVLMSDEYCKACHADAFEQWSHSAHRLSSFNNPAYRFSVRETRRVTTGRGNPRGARFCAACHDPVPLFSGAFDDPAFDDERHPTANAGITCTACHAITRVDSPRGNGDYTIASPVHYPFAFSESPLLKWVNHQLVKAKPAFHKKTFLKPLHREPEFCGACHKVHLPKEVNGYKWLRGQNHYDSYLLSGVSGHGATSYYYPEQPAESCAGCHMPLTESTDFGAQHYNDSGRLTVHDHQFRGANTALPHLLAMPAWVNERHRQFLEGVARVDLFGLREGGAITDPLRAPLGPEVPALRPGGEYLLEVVIRTLGVGHVFTQGTSDSNEVWLDVTVTDDGRPLGRSGGMAGDGAVDPWSHFVNAYVLDRNGDRIDRRNAHDIFTALYDHQVPPGAADVVHYRLRVPEDARGPLTVEVALAYRKFDTTYLRHFEGDRFAGNDLPVTVIARDRATFPIERDPGRVDSPADGDIPSAPAAPAAAEARAEVPTWQRWNDFGIGLLRKGQRGELRQAETAFREVERLGRPDGPVNLARVYLREGRLDEAREALRRAASHDPPAYPWVVAWLSAQVDLQNGNLDEAVAGLRRVLATDFAEARRRGFDFGLDYRVRNELGQALFERAKTQRGEGRRAERDRLLAEAAGELEEVLRIDPENLTAHYNLSLVYALTGARERAEAHRALYEQYRPDDNAREVAVTRHRRANPAADHAAEAVVIYDLQRPGAPGLAGDDPARLGLAAKDRAWSLPVPGTAPRDTP
jgi:tetratricopeptide (TPR) repeat protein